MKRQSYSISGKWTIAAPLDTVWDALMNHTTWKTWWPDVRDAHQLEEPQLVAVKWNGIPGHTMHVVVDTEDYKEHENVRFKFSGDISGHGELWLRVKNRQTTSVTFGWEVQTVQPWMNYAPEWMQKLFRRSAERSMRRAEKGLNKYLSEK
jgi:uncharacterized protein YndB with AHSA1/START domain